MYTGDLPHLTLLLALLVAVEICYVHTLLVLLRRVTRPLGARVRKVFRAVIILSALITSTCGLLLAERLLLLPLDPTACATAIPASGLVMRPRLLPFLKAITAWRSPMGNQQDFVLNPLKAAYDRLTAREPTLTHEALAAELGFHKTQFSKWCNWELIPEKWWRPLARRLAADEEEEEDLFRGFASWAATSVNDALANARVRALQYGHIDVAELVDPVKPSGPSTGPTGILVECFHRFSEFAGESPLDPEPKVGA